LEVPSAQALISVDQGGSKLDADEGSVLRAD
jgi:hypothetical protein